MAFAYTIQKRGVIGDLRYISGTFTNGGADTGGDIVTGFSRVEHVSLQHTGSAVVASAPVVNETFPYNGSAVTIVTVADADGTFFIVGQE